jgi:hypothetical protein
MTTTTLQDGKIDFSGLSKPRHDDSFNFNTLPFDEREMGYHSAGSGASSTGGRKGRFYIFFFVPIGAIAAIAWSFLHYGDVNVRLHNTAIISGDTMATMVYQSPELSETWDINKQFRGDAVTLGGASTDEDVQEFVKEAKAEYRTKLNLLRNN